MFLLALISIFIDKFRCELRICDLYVRESEENEDYSKRFDVQLLSDFHHKEPESQYADQVSSLVVFSESREDRDAMR